MSLSSKLPVIILFAAVLLLLAPANSAPLELEPPLSRTVTQWTVSDVERWMNFTVGYAEYVSTIKLHAIDGPTLLFLTGREIEDHFNVLNSIHLAKIRAHLQLLRTGCVCPRQSSAQQDFWSSLKEDNARTWVFGVTALFMPRTAILGAYLWDSELFAALHAEPRTVLSEEMLSLAATEEQSGATSLPPATPWSFILMSMFCPCVLLLVKAAYFFDANYVLVVAAIAHFAIGEYNELGLIYLAARGKLIEPGDKKIITLLKTVVGFAPLFPLAAVVTSYFIPYFLQQLAVGVFVLYSAMCTVGVVAMAVKHFTNTDTSGATPEQPHPEKHE
jgi:hypothetical protein